MTLSELVAEVDEKTCAGRMDILDRVLRAWPNTAHFTPTQAALMAYVIAKDQYKNYQEASYTNGAIIAE